MIARWEIVPMGTICSIKNGKSNSVDAEESAPYAFFDRSKKIKRSSHLYDCEALIIPGEGAEFLPRHFVGKFDLHQRAYALSNFTQAIDVKFLYYYLIHSKDYFPRVAVGATVKSLRLRHFENLPVPTPPRPEQQRIVAILDKAFAVIATAKANTEKNLLNARDLFEACLRMTFGNHNGDWRHVTVGDHIHFIDYRGKTPKKTESGVRLITAKNVKMGYLQANPKEFVAPSTYKSWMTRGIPRKGDILFTTEAPLANVAQLDTDEKVVFAQRIIIMQPDDRKLDRTFVKYLLLSPAVQDRIRAKGTGATVQGIKASLLRQVEISFPDSLEKQRASAAELDALRSETERLQSAYSLRLAELTGLKKSLLDLAFSGKL